MKNKVLLLVIDAENKPTVDYVQRWSGKEKCN